MEIYIILIATCFFLAVAAYTYFSVFNQKITPYGVDSMNIEVFCCSLVGFGRLQTNNNIGQLQPGYNYATASEINQCLVDGMVIPGVQTGDLALYLDDGYFDGSRAPNTYVCQQGDFSSPHQISFTPSTTYVKQTNYWVFIKGNKPTQEYGNDQNIIFTSDSNIVSYSGVLPWNTKQWNSDVIDEISSGGAEVFIADITPIPSDITFLRDSLHSEFTLATPNQVFWAISRGLNHGQCNNIQFAPLDSKNLNSLVVEFGCSSPISTYAIWGPKPKNPTDVFSTFSSTKIHNFNDKKYSLYQ